MGSRVAGGKVGVVDGGDKFEVSGSLGSQRKLFVESAT